MDYIIVHLAQPDLYGQLWGGQSATASSMALILGQEIIGTRRHIKIYKVTQEKNCN